MINASESRSLIVFSWSHLCCVSFLSVKSNPSILSFICPLLLSNWNLRCSFQSTWHKLGPQAAIGSLMILANFNAMRGTYVILSKPGFFRPHLKTQRSKNLKLKENTHNSSTKLKFFANLVKLFSEKNGKHVQITV